jgi:hypothetical protein
MATIGMFKVHTGTGTRTLVKMESQSVPVKVSPAA